MKMTMESVSDMAAKYWIKNGVGPTHILMSVEQQNELSLELNPRMRFGASGLDQNGKVTVLHIGPGISLDIIPVSALISGNHHNISYPKLLRIEE